MNFMIFFISLFLIKSFSRFTERGVRITLRAHMGKRRSPCCSSSKLSQTTILKVQNQEVRTHMGKRRLPCCSSSKNRTHQIPANRGIWSSLANVRVFSAHQEIMANKKSRSVIQKLFKVRIFFKVRSNKFSIF